MNTLPKESPQTYDSEGRLAGIEILDAVKRFGGQETLRQIIVEGIGPSVDVGAIRGESGRL